MLINAPVLGICGYSGSGKTTLIEAVLPELTASGLHIAVVKHDVHGLSMDDKGKDSGRLYQAGADIYLDGPESTLTQNHAAIDTHLNHAMATRALHYDLILVEGYKQATWNRIWLQSTHTSEKTADDTLASLPRDCDRKAWLLDFLHHWLAKQWLKTPVYACVLIGGKSKRMGQAKHLIQTQNISWLERSLMCLDHFVDQRVITGRGHVPEHLSGMTRLPDAPGFSGPMAGILAAMRWAPDAAWLVVACDMPELSTEALAWLLDQRRPGVWAVQPSTGTGQVEPLLAYYDPRAGRLYEQLATSGQLAPRAMATHPKCISPRPGPDIIGAWKNVNCPKQLDTLDT